jgi:hypothetical protein
MGIAWFDAKGDSEPEVNGLRTGGKPALPPHTPWPRCPVTDLPMLFRAQLPLASTGLVTPDDERLLAVFESYTDLGSGIRGTDGVGIVTRSTEHELLPPPTSAHDVVILRWGPTPERVMPLATLLADEGLHVSVNTPLPFTLMRATPHSISAQTAQSLHETGATVDLLPHPPTTLGFCKAGEIIPYEDQIPGNFRTTLPPLSQLQDPMEKSRMRALLGSDGPNTHDPSLMCCEKPMRTVARLLGAERPSPNGVRLRPSVVYLCLRCDRSKVVPS